MDASFVSPCLLQGLANVLWGLGKLGVELTPELQQMVDALCAEALAQLTHARHKGALGCVYCAL
jgi:hypothetical protein